MTTNVRRWLVGDIGGTNARFGLVDELGVVREPRALPRRDYASVADAISDYLSAVGAPDKDGIALAAAGPVVDGAVRFTNRGWSSSETALRELGFREAVILNDFAALAEALRVLGPAECRRIGPPVEGDPGAACVVLGPGTGLGVGALARRNGRSVVVSGEGGHVGFAPCDEVEFAVARRLAAIHGRVSIERILSGPGLSDLHDILQELAGRPAPRLPAPEITEAATGRREPECVETVDRFCAILGSVCGDFALAFGARGGVWLTGGVAQALAPVLEAGPFRSRFEDKGRMAPYVSAIPTRLITDPLAALRGLAALVTAG
ncbi:MAG: glucokinase [Caulobacteraceae bacterium]|nr:glucokinase [Caulobacteraceae bacterium]